MFYCVDSHHKHQVRSLILRTIIFIQRDPVTKKPRYGEKTKQRMKAVIRTYRALKNGLTNIFEDSTKPSMISLLRSQIQQHNEHINATKQARLLQEQVETERLVKERILAEEREIQQRLQEEKRKRDEERELARRAEEARVRRLEEEQAVIDAERREDSDLLALVPIIGVEGVREQIGRMRDGLRMTERRLIWLLDHCIHYSSKLYANPRR